MNNYKQTAISQLLSSGYKLFVPLYNYSLDYDYIVEYANVLQTVKILPTYLDKNISKVSLTHSKPPQLRNVLLLQLLACVKNNTVWLIPYEDVCLNTSISLKSRYDSYILTEEVLSTNNDSTKSVFTEIAGDIANHIVTERYKNEKPKTS